ncbi:MAG: protein translocase subunit SecD, partial [Planctomycetota bacterium]
MRNLAWKIVFIIALLGLCLWAVYPPKDRVRLGKDLRGGVSLVYHVNIDPRDPNPQATVTQVITVLKERVNPKGVLDISMQPLGFDRIEIVMPLPSKTVRVLRETYERTLETLLRDAQISRGELRAALAAGQALERFGGEAGSRRDMVEALQASYETVQEALDKLEKAEESGTDAAALRPFQAAVAEAEIDFETLEEDVLRLSIDRGQVERALRLATTREPVTDAQGNPQRDPDTGAVLLTDSPRDIEIDDIKENFPHVVGGLDALLADYDAYAAERTGFDDPEDLMRLLRGAGVLEYHIGVRSTDPQGVNVDDLRNQLAERGPENTDSPIGKWFPINDLKQWYDTPEQLVRLQADPVTYFSGAGSQDLVAAKRGGVYYLLLYINEPRSMTHEGGRAWSIVRTFPTVDNFGRPAVGFQLDGPGGREMNRLTGPHVGEPMAIVLDGEVYSAPRINQAIGSNGIIQGNFSDAELSYLTRVLAAGALEARLTPEPIAINTLGPSIGADNLNRGLEAFMISIIAVAVFMMLYYFFAGMVADFALVANGVIIFGVMSLIDGTFTLPGLAGIVLTIGMAVDANVLIYERVREELFGGDVDLRGAIRLGYSKALSTILDANVTNLIVCFVLFRTATTEVKGFALTLSIGICATLFTALFVTRVIYELYTDVVKFARLPMLPTVFPLIHRMLEPDINWIGLRKIFWTVSVLAVASSVVLVEMRGVDMFDTEFRGGVAVTMRTAILDEDRDGAPDELDADGEPRRLWLPHTGPDGVEDRVRALAGVLDAGPGDEAGQAAKSRLLAALRIAGVQTASWSDQPVTRAEVEALRTAYERVRDAVLAAADIEADELQLAVEAGDVLDRYGDRGVTAETADALQDAWAALLPALEQYSVRSTLAEVANASVLTVGATEVRAGVVHAPSFQVKVASPKGLDEEKTTTDVVVAAVVSEFGDQLDVTRPLSFAGAGSVEHADHTFPITRDKLGDNIDRPRALDRVTEFLGGVAVVVEDLDPPVTLDDLAKRVSRMRGQPDFANCVGRDVAVFGLETADPAEGGRGYRSVAVVVYDQLLSSFDVDFELWDRELAGTEWRLVSQALQRQTSLEQVSGFSSAVAETLSAKAIVAVALSLMGILVYIWIRFGSLRYSAAAIAALVHDVTIAMGVLALTAWVGGTTLSSALLVEEFRIDLGVVAALLTVIGYSLNDTIVILDRIRENRGKLPIPTPDIVNRSINQTISRTVLTSFTTLLAVGIMYAAGGSGIRPF